MTALNITLTDEDKKKIAQCDQYKHVKRIMATAEKNKELEVGTAVLIGYKKSDGTLDYVTKGSNWRSRKTDPPSKFLIISNDDGFVFAKRIIASGKPGSQIFSLTTDYLSDRYELVPDDEYIEAVLLDKEYDPAAEQKALQKRKNKASSTNKKKRLVFPTPKQAADALKNYKVGDSIWWARTSFGSDIEEFKVTCVTVRAVKADPPGNRRRWSSNAEDNHHEDAGLTEFVKLELQQVDTQKYSYSYKNSVIFTDICSHQDYKYSRRNWYSSRPVSTDEVNV